jgi:hypothetical protein
MEPNEIKSRCIGAIAGFAIGEASGFDAIDKQWLIGIENPDILIGTGEKRVSSRSHKA